MSDKLDLSAFDEEVELDLSAFDEELDSSLAKEEKSDIDGPNIAQTSLLKEGLSDLGSETKKGLKGIGKSALSKVPFGNLDRDDLSSLYNQRERYKELKKAPGILGDKFAEFAEDVQDTGYTATKNVGDVLEAKGIKVKTDDLIDDLGKRASDIKYKPDAERLKEAASSKKEAKIAKANLEKAQETFSKEDIKNRNKLEKIEDKLTEYKQKRFEKQELDRARDLKIKSINEEIDYLKDQKYGDPALTKEVNRKIELLRRSKRKTQEDLKKNTYGIKKKVESEVNQIKKLEKEKTLLERKIKNQIKPAREEKLSRLKELQSQALEKEGRLSIKRKALTEDAEKYLDRMKKQLGNKKTLTGQDLASEMKRLNKEFGKSGADEIRGAFREMLNEMSSYVGESGTKAAKAITDYENTLKDISLEQVTDFTEKGKGTKVRQKSDFNRSLAGAFTPKEGAQKVAKSDIVDMLKRYGRQDLINDAELNKISHLVNESSASLADAFAAVSSGGLAASPTSRVLENIGTKAQELGTLAAGKISDLAKSPVGKALGTAGKLAGKALPLVGAAVDYSEASELGIESPLGKAAYAAVESLNPLPLSAVDLARQAPMRSAAARRAGAANYGMQEGPKQEITINQLKDPDNTQELIHKLSALETQSSSEYARRIQNVVNGARTKEDYERKMGMIASDPAFREIMRRLKKD